MTMIILTSDCAVIVVKRSAIGWRSGPTIKFIIFLAKSGEMCWPVGKYILVGVLVGTVVERYLPYQWIYKLFGGKDPLSIVWVTLGSVPLFLHQISASSILYHIKSSLDGTLNAGAALAFIIGGPVTAIPTLALFWTYSKNVSSFSICPSVSSARLSLLMARTS